MLLQLDFPLCEKKKCQHSDWTVSLGLISLVAVCHICLGHVPTLGDTGLMRPGVCHGVGDVPASPSWIPTPAVFPSSSAGGHMAVLIDSDVLDWYQTSRSHETKHMHYMDGVLVVAHKNHGCSETHLKAEERRVHMFRMWSCHAHEFEGIYTSCRPNKSVMSTRQIQTSCE